MNNKKITPPRNISRERCLVCCPEELFTPEHAAILISLGYEVKTVRSSRHALREFMFLKPSLLLVYHKFLPVFPHRLIQLFKMSHRTPAVLFLAEKSAQVLGYLSLKNETYFEFMETPLRPEDLALGVKLASERLRSTRQKLFASDLMTLIAFAVPIVALLVYLAVNYTK